MFAIKLAFLKILLFDAILNFFLKNPSLNRLKLGEGDIIYDNLVE